jgi:hypothetical protein
MGLLVYRSALIESGRTSEREAAQARQTAAVDQAHADASQITETVVESLNAKLNEKEKAHDLRVRDLELALAASDLRGRRLSSELARLLDDAAGVRPGTPAAPAGTGSPAREVEADPAADADLAEFVSSVEVNYATCTRNSVRLENLQEWYRRLAAE